VKYNDRGFPEESGDLIVAIHGRLVDNVEDYERVVRDLKVGEQVMVKIIRGTTEMEIPVTVDGV
jgi:S1-C subfamily serine protease